MPRNQNLRALGLAAQILIVTAAMLVALGLTVYIPIRIDAAKSDLAMISLITAGLASILLYKLVDLCTLWRTVTDEPDEPE